MSLVNKNKQFANEVVNKIAKKTNMSYEQAYDMFCKLSQKKRRRLILTYVQNHIQNKG